MVFYYLQFELSKLILHGKEFNTNDTDANTKKDDHELTLSVKYVLVHDYKPCDNPHDHEASLVDGHNFDLIIVLHGKVEQMDLE